MESEISSSQIRKNLRDGKLLEANNMLSRNWQIISRVISGKKKQARKIGFKTANLKLMNIVICTTEFTSVKVQY